MIYAIDMMRTILSRPLNKRIAGLPKNLQSVVMSYVGTPSATAISNVVKSKAFSEEKGKTLFYNALLDFLRYKYNNEFSWDPFGMNLYTFNHHRENAAEDRRRRGESILNDDKAVIHVLRNIAGDGDNKVFRNSTAGFAEYMRMAKKGDVIHMCSERIYEYEIGTNLITDNTEEIHFNVDGIRYNYEKYGFFVVQVSRKRDYVLVRSGLLEFRTIDNVTQAERWIDDGNARYRNPLYKTTHIALQPDRNIIQSADEFCSEYLHFIVRRFDEPLTTVDTVEVELDDLDTTI